MRQPSCRQRRTGPFSLSTTRSQHSPHVAPRQAKIVELRYFGGLTEEEIVAALKISPRTVRRDWDLAKSWLLRELSHK